MKISHHNIKIEKYFSICGICSRREANRLIFNQRVKVNGEILTNPAHRVHFRDVVQLDDKIISVKNDLKIWRYYKPLGLICTNHDPMKRKTIFDQIAESYNIKDKLISVGRLDLNSEGLLLMTNNGEFAREMELPGNAVKRVYKVRAFGDLKYFVSKKIFELKKNFNYQIQYLQITRKNHLGKNHWFKIILTEGKNREVRKIFAYLGLYVNKLIRTEFGQYKLHNLKPGELILEKSQSSINKFSKYYLSDNK